MLLHQIVRTESLESFLQKQAQQIDPIFQAVAASIQFPEDSPAVSPQSYKERQDWESTLEIMTERRYELLLLFKNIAKLQPDKTVDFLRQQLELKLTPQSGFQVSELQTLILKPQCQNHEKLHQK